MTSINRKKWEASLTATCFNVRQFPPSRGLEVALAGRSNVGKSTFINGLIQKPLARVSSTPGKTRSANFFKVNAGKGFTLVDLPGFGFASRSRSERAAWAKLIEEFMIHRDNLVLLVHLVDFRHGLLENDRIFQEWATGHGIPVQVVFTKIDKISRGRWASLLKQYSAPPTSSVVEPFLVSMEKDWGAEKFVLFLESYLEDIEASRPQGQRRGREGSAFLK
ncbi:MAG: YihA family ribosome biogenesis GTP-binding protein [Thermovirga sp.]|jgi:GTP-binding protein|nr:YihA family ribosome biogenesis GTP-binding protein [Thermovirga sp.]